MLLSAFFVFALLQTSLSLPTTPPPSFIEEATNVLPKKELQDLKMKHLKTDPGFQAAVVYFKSPEWVSTIEEVRQTPEWIDYKRFVKEAGLDLDYFVNHVEHCLNATNTEEFKVAGVKPSLKSFLEDVKMTYGIPIMQGMHQYLEKVGKTDAYKKFFEQMVSVKSKEMLEKVMEQVAVKKAVKKLQEIDVNVEYLLQMVYTFSGWQPLPEVKA